MIELCLTKIAFIVDYFHPFVVDIFFNRGHHSCDSTREDLTAEPHGITKLDIFSASSTLLYSVDRI